MSKYYCHKCAIKRGLLGNVHTDSLIGNEYQLEKYIKHTLPSTNVSFVSIFNDPSTEAYRNNIVYTSCAGAVEIDDRGRKNIIWFSTGKVGASYKNGVYDIPHDAVKVVLSSDSDRIHAFTNSSTNFITTPCLICGRPIIA